MSGNQEKSEKIWRVGELQDFSVSPDFFVCIVLHCIAIRTVLLYMRTVLLY